MHCRQGVQRQDEHGFSPRSRVSGIDVQSEFAVGQRGADSLARLGLRDAGEGLAVPGDEEGVAPLEHQARVQHAQGHLAPLQTQLLAIQGPVPSQWQSVLQVIEAVALNLDCEQDAALQPVLQAGELLLAVVQAR